MTAPPVPSPQSPAPPVAGRLTLILGCGDLGVAVGARIAAAGGSWLGVRRTAEPPLIAGNLADPLLYDQLPPADAVGAILIAAGPGLRRGRDNRLADGAKLVAARFPHVRLVYSATTAVYADAQGGAVDEGGALAGDPASLGLLAIEAAVAGHRDAVILRFPALVGPGRSQLRSRIAATAASGATLTVKGDGDRPFSICHEDDAARLCQLALAGVIPTGVWNAASPEPLTLLSYYRRQAAIAGVALPPVVWDGMPQPSRRITAGRLWRLLPGFAWSSP
jgi:nucleoside-diphosphate-sugar epimerase